MKISVGQKYRVAEDHPTFGGLTGTVLSVRPDEAELQFKGSVAGHAGNAQDCAISDRWFFFKDDSEGGDDIWGNLTLVSTAPSIASDLKLKKQSKTVLRHLEREDHISPMQALIVYGISRLAACVYDIRKAGYEVRVVNKKDAEGHRYAQYSLPKACAA